MDHYHGQAASTIDNGQLRLVYLAEAGPRLVGLYPAGSQHNLLAETPDLGWDTRPAA